MTIAAGALALAAPPTPIAWRTDCLPGQDEFVSNCRATAVRGGLRITFQTGDSQVVLSVEAMGCGADRAALSRTWWRADLAGRSPRRRKALFAGVVREAVRTLARRCPGIDRRPFDLGAIPDITLAADPADKPPLLP